MVTRTTAELKELSPKLIVLSLAFSASGFETGKITNFRISEIPRIVTVILDLEPVSDTEEANPRNIPKVLRAR